jgi:hypothetical protein
MKAAFRTGGRDTLNVYVADLQGGMLGWVTYPWQTKDNLAGDAVMVDFQALPGGAKAAYDEGDSLVHGAGHWLGLFHTFANGCEEAGDSVDDTPAEASPSNGCSGDRDTGTADGLDPVTNFMDYSPDACMFAFTPGQAERMSLAGPPTAPEPPSPRSRAGEPGETALGLRSERPCGGSGPLSRLRGDG